MIFLFFFISVREAEGLVTTTTIKGWKYLSTWTWADSLVQYNCEELQLFFAKKKGKKLNSAEPESRG